MYRFLLKPKWIAFTLLVLVAVVVMVNLAFWQIRRLHEREAFNDAGRTRTPTMAVAPIDDVLVPGADPDDIEWRRVEVDRHLRARTSRSIEVNRSQDGDAGRNVVDPLQQADGSVLIVNRGFVPGTDAGARRARRAR